jgi:WD repeat-containing protein 76
VLLTLSLIDSLHPNGNYLISAGLDTCIHLWDLRAFRKNKSKVKSLHTFENSKSINSAFYSPSGDYVLSTTMNDTLDLWKNIEQQPEKPEERIAHDNQTGRWLTTFMAQWHPQYDIFCVGSMAKPRRFEVLEPRTTNSSIVQGTASRGTSKRLYAGEAMTAVVSRCCFHPTLNVIAGGNSSGRVTIVR